MAMERRVFLATMGAAVATARHALTQTKSYTLVSDTLGKTLKTPDGRTVFQYMTKKPEETVMSANSVCCFHPLNTPAGERVTIFGEGHRHYRGVFFAWHTVEFREKIPPSEPPRGRKPQQGQETGGARRSAPPAPSGPRAAEIEARTNAPTRGNVFRGDFWGWGRYAPLGGRVIRNRDVLVVNADAHSAELEMRNEWVISDRALMQEVTTAIVREIPSAFVLDLTYKFTPTDMDMVLDEWSFGGLVVAGRSDAESAYYEGPTGKVDLPQPGMVDGDTDWPAADWYSRTATLKGGKVSGTAVIDHPSNPKTRWWNPPSTGNLNPSIVTYGEVSVPQGETLNLRYRVLAYDGTFPAGRMRELSSEFRSA